MLISKALETSASTFIPVAIISFNGISFSITINEPVLVSPSANNVFVSSSIVLSDNLSGFSCFLDFFFQSIKYCFILLFPICSKNFFISC